MGGGGGTHASKMMFKRVMVLLEFQYLSGENIPEGGACIVYYL